LGADFLNMKSNTILDLISIPKHHTILGVDCETYISSSPSIFKHDPMDIEIFVRKMADLPVDKMFHLCENFSAFLGQFCVAACRKPKHQISTIYTQKERDLSAVTRTRSSNVA
jgi:hypothetical protein